MYPRKTRKTGPGKKFSGGRTCKKNGCKQKLSTYNAEEYCNLHRGEIYTQQEKVM